MGVLPIFYTDDAPSAEYGLFRSRDGVNWERIANVGENLNTIFQEPGGTYFLGSQTGLRMSPNGDFQNSWGMLSLGGSVELFYAPDDGSHMVYICYVVNGSTTVRRINAHAGGVFELVARDIPGTVKSAVLGFDGKHYLVADGQAGPVIAPMTGPIKLAETGWSLYPITAFDGYTSWTNGYTSGGMLLYEGRAVDGSPRLDLVVGGVEVNGGAARGVFCMPYRGFEIGSHLDTTPIVLPNKHVRNQITRVICGSSSNVAGSSYQDAIQAFPIYSDPHQEYPIFKHPDHPMDYTAWTYFSLNYPFGSSNRGHFTNLVFNVVTPASPSSSVQWVYLTTDGEWSPLGASANDMFNDETDGFKRSGMGCVTFQPPSDWNHNGSFGLVNTVQQGDTTLEFPYYDAEPGFWVAALLFDHNGVAPTLRGPIFTAALPYMSVDAVSGDLPALAKLQLKVSGDWVSRVMLSARSKDRGAGFTPYLNLSTFLQPDGVTVAAGPAGAIEPETYMEKLSPTGYDSIRQVMALENRWLDICTISISPEVMQQYYGTFRAYLRYRVVLPVGTTRVRLALRSGSGQPTVYSDEDIITGNATVFSLANLGRITLPSSSAIIQEEIAESMSITVQMHTTDNSMYIRLYDIILMPVDEWNGNFYDTTHVDSARADTGNIIEIDSASSRLNYMRAVIKTAAGKVRSVWQPVATGELKIASNSRLWALAGRYFPGEITKPSFSLAAGKLNDIDFSPWAEGAFVGDNGNFYTFSSRYQLFMKRTEVVTTDNFVGVSWEPTTPDWNDEAWIVAHRGTSQLVFYRYWRDIRNGGMEEKQVITEAARPTRIQLLSTTDGWALGGSVYRFNGTTWSKQRTPTVPQGQTFGVNGMHMLSAKLGWAVGSRVYKYDPEWRKLDNEDVVDMYAVVSTGVKQGWAVGKAGTIYKCTNGTWKKNSSPTTANLNGLAIGWSGSDYRLCAVGGEPKAGATSGSEYVPVIMRYESTVGRWEKATTLPDGNINLLAASLGSYDWGLAVSKDKLIQTENGGVAWTDITPTLPENTNIDFTTVYCWMEGTTRRAFVIGRGMAWELVGSAWYKRPIDVMGAVRSIAYDGASMWAVGENGMILRWESINGTYRWIAKPSPVSDNLWGIAFYNNQPGQGFIVGEFGTILRRQSTDVWELLAWNSGEEPTLKNLYGVAKDGQGRFHAAGAEGVALYYDDGWQDTGVLPDGMTGYGVYFEDENNGWAVGAPAASKTTNVARYSYGTWEGITHPSTNQLVDISKIAGTITAVGDDGVYRYADDGWTAVSSAFSPKSGEKFRACAPASATDGWVGSTIGSAEYAYHFMSACWDWNPSTITLSGQLSVQPRYLSMRGDDDLVG